ncbi:MAG: zinc ribbon domain-containing protein [Nitrospiraceae bacterium]|nr:MAG: zinc ribbon domain-containing protein [Nitrospiraceae bacterium]
MPIYEFYCEKCNTIYNFFSRTINTEKVPDCPHCKNVKLSRKVSMFASLSNKKEGGEDDPMANFDEAKMEKAMAMLEKEAGSLNEDDPRQAARLMRKLTDATGLSMGPGMEEAMRRLERGEDPEQIEAEMGDLIEKEEPFIMEGKGKKGGSKPKPKVDEELYEL